MITRLRSIFSSTCDENSSIIGLYRTKSNWYVKINIQNFSLLSFVINIIEGYNLLIKFKEMNFVCSSCFNLLCICCRSAYHSNSSLSKVIRHGQLRISIEANVLILLNLLIQIIVSYCISLIGSWLPSNNIVNNTRCILQR